MFFVSSDECPRDGCVLSIFATRLVPSGRFLAGHSSTAVEKTEQVLIVTKNMSANFLISSQLEKILLPGISQKQFRFDYLIVDRTIVPHYHGSHGEGYTEKGMAPAA